MKEEIVLTDLFRFPLGRIFLNQDIKKMQKMVKVIQQKSGSVHKSNRGGYQSSDNLQDLDIPGFKELAIKVLTLAGKYSSIFHLNRPIKYSNSWLNINPYLTSNDSHTHPYSIVSAVYYIKVPSNSGNLIIKNPLDNLFGYINDKDINVFNAFNGTIQTIVPRENELILFPAWLKHSVTENMSKQNRISLAFNFS